MHIHLKPETYWGSILFFKHFIITMLVLMILIPSSLCVALAHQSKILKLKILSAELLLSDEPIKPESSHQQTLDIQQPAWQALYPQLYAFPSQRSTVNQEKTVYLTFDDGPSARTPEILQILATYNIKATFFVVGKSDEQSQQWMRDIVAAGHTLGIHSYSHQYKTIYASVESYLEDFKQIYDLIYSATGCHPQIFRFPGGSINGYNSTTYEAIISELVRRGFVYFDWNVSAGDAASGGPVSAETLCKNATASIHSLRRAVVLMHDSAAKTTTVEALPQLIAQYQKAGFTFAPLTPEVVPIVYTYPK